MSLLDKKKYKFEKFKHISIKNLEPMHIKYILTITISQNASLKRTQRLEGSTFLWNEALVEAISRA